MFSRHNRLWSDFTGHLLLWYVALSGLRPHAPNSPRLATGRCFERGTACRTKRAGLFGREREVYRLRRTSVPTNRKKLLPPPPRREAYQLFAHRRVYCCAHPVCRDHPPQQRTHIALQLLVFRHVRFPSPRRVRRDGVGAARVHPKANVLCDDHRARYFVKFCGKSIVIGPKHPQQ